MSTAPRLYVTLPLAQDAELALEVDQSHYLSTVMRREAGDPVRLFNGADGEWRAVIVKAGKKTVLRCGERTREQAAAPDLHLLFAPLKKARTDFIVEKATELGAAAIIPVFTERSIAERVRTDRLEAIAREAAEQTERLDLPKIYEPQRLGPLLERWSSPRALVYCDEAGDDEGAMWGGTEGRAPPALDVLQRALVQRPTPTLPQGGGSSTQHASPAEGERYGTLDVADIRGSSPSPLGEGRGGGRPDSSLQALAHARRMRGAPTPAEAKLWELLRGLKRTGAHFRRQAVIGPFIADFACLSAKLIVEADGGGHGIIEDQQRDDWLRSQGYRVVRVWNSDILNNPAGVAEQIDIALAECLNERPTPTLPQGGGRTELDLPQGGARTELGPAERVLENRLRSVESVAVLIGPEGGFTIGERQRLRAHGNVIPVSLGPRILRADTAAVAALTLVQAVWGDWR